MRKPQLIVYLILAATLGLSACGQKGPLYLSEEQQAAQAEAQKARAAEYAAAAEERARAQAEAEAEAEAQEKPAQ